MTNFTRASQRWLTLSHEAGRPRLPASQQMAMVLGKLRRISTKGFFLGGTIVAEAMSLRNCPFLEKYMACWDLLGLSWIIKSMMLPKMGEVYGLLWLLWLIKI